MELLANASWPGNVRELQNVVERAIILSRGEVLDRPDFELPGLMAASPPMSETAERQQIEDALRVAWAHLGRRRSRAGAGSRAQHARIPHSASRGRQARLSPAPQQLTNVDSGGLRRPLRLPPPLAFG
jgi:DNA-binding NtrC family response regulator